MEEMKEMKIKVELVFDNKTGELLDVHSIEGRKTELGDRITIEDLMKAELSKFTTHTILFGWGSPGCTIYSTKYGGYIKIC